VGRKKEHRLLEGSQASPVRPTDKSESEDVRMVGSSSLRQGARNFDL
jgi:hypothetical protein